jgi:hypothetical protein
MIIPDIELHCHLWYSDKYKNLLDKLGSKFNNRINLSLISGCDHNDKIIEYAKSKFKDVRYVTVDNCGTDQNGFLKSYDVNKEMKEWVLYTHDKADETWTMDLVDPLLTDEALKYCEDGESGIITSSKRHTILPSQEEIDNQCQKTLPELKHTVIPLQSTIIWLTQLQDNLKQLHHMQDTLLNLEFTAGTMFLSRSLILRLAHTCVEPEFFKTGHQPDGEVEHAMERFYFYVNNCLNLKHRRI